MQDQSPIELPVLSRSSRKDSQSAPASLAAIIKRVEVTVETETAAIRSVPRFDLKASNARKSRHLYDLTKAIKNVGETAALAEHRESLLRLREKLVANEAAINAHLNAVGEIAGLLRDAIQHAETDGTYTAGAFGQAG